jgi:hypothetical protein
MHMSCDKAQKRDITLSRVSNYGTQVPKRAKRKELDEGESGVPAVYLSSSQALVSW